MNPILAIKNAICPKCHTLYDLEEDFGDMWILSCPKCNKWIFVEEMDHLNGKIVKKMKSEF